MDNRLRYGCRLSWKTRKRQIIRRGSRNTTCQWSNHQQSRKCRKSGKHMPQRMLPTIFRVPTNTRRASCGQLTIDGNGCTNQCKTQIPYAELSYFFFEDWQLKECSDRNKHKTYHCHNNIVIHNRNPWVVLFGRIEYVVWHENIDGQTDDERTPLPYHHVCITCM